MLAFLPHTIPRLPLSHPIPFAPRHSLAIKSPFSLKPSVQTVEWQLSIKPQFPPIRAMACDLDGTLLSTKVSVSARNIAVIKRLLEDTNIIFFPATGKSRAGAINSMASLGKTLQRIYPAGCPGVFLQGLIVFGTDGEILHENYCDEGLARMVATVAKELDVSLLAYNRDSLLCERRDYYVDLLPTYREPQPQPIGDWETVIGKRPLNKFIFMADPKRIDEIRPLVQRSIGESGRLTQAQSNMLEVLPLGSSKGHGVKRLLEAENVDPQNVLAIGDAENDLELLKMVGYSCAVANALPSVKKVAKFTDFGSNDEDAVAECIERFIFAEAGSVA